MAKRNNLRGQGATEYMIIFAIALVVLLVLMGLLGFFPSTTSDTKAMQSDSYWKGARPFAIIGYKMSSGGNSSFLMQNMETTSTMTLDSIELRPPNEAPHCTASGISAQFDPGDTRLVDIACPGGQETGSTYELLIEINYTSSNGMASTEKNFGKALVGKYT